MGFYVKIDQLGQRAKLWQLKRANGMRYKEPLNEQETALGASGWCYSFNEDIGKAWIGKFIN